MWSLVDVSGGSFGHWLVKGSGIFDWLKGLLRFSGVGIFSGAVGLPSSLLSFVDKAPETVLESD